MFSIKIHETQPLLNLKLDRVRQDIRLLGIHKYVRCSVRAQIHHLRRVLCRRLELPLVLVLFDNAPVPDSMTLKQLWLSCWFGKPAPLLLHYSVKEKRR
uniref:RAWUL domain-containing protein n=1 Tax=Anolis carolinensis TaxID=28377 RepID=A0A803SL46_ANOCA